MIEKIDQIPKKIQKGEQVAGLTISYKHQIDKWVISYGRTTSNNIYYKDNIVKVGIGDTLDEAFSDFMQKIKSYKLN